MITKQSPVCWIKDQRSKKHDGTETDAAIGNEKSVHQGSKKHGRKRWSERREANMSVIDPGLRASQVTDVSRDGSAICHNASGHVYLISFFLSFSLYFWTCERTFTVDRSVTWLFRHLTGHQARINHGHISFYCIWSLLDIQYGHVTVTVTLPTLYMHRNFVVDTSSVWLRTMYCMVTTGIYLTVSLLWVEAHKYDYSHK